MFLYSLMSTWVYTKNAKMALTLKILDLKFYVTPYFAHAMVPYFWLPKITNLDQLIRACLHGMPFTCGVIQYINVQFIVGFK